MKLQPSRHVTEMGSATGRTAREPCETQASEQHLGSTQRRPSIPLGLHEIQRTSLRLRPSPCTLAGTCSPKVKQGVQETGRQTLLNADTVSCDCTDSSSSESKWSQKHKTSCERADMYAAAKPVSLSEEAMLRPLTCAILFNRKGINGTVCVGSACYISRLLPSAFRAPRALQGPGRRCTSAATRANPCKTAPASCRRPGTRTGQRRGRHPTPGDPALWTRAKTESANYGQKGRLNVRFTAQRKNDVRNFNKNVPRENLSPLRFKKNRKNKNRIKLQSLPF